MFWRIRRQLAQARFDLACRAIRATGPLRLRPAPIRVVSMIGTRDIAMYLIAVKSFYARIPGGEIVVLDDGTLTAGDRAALHHHLGGPRIERIADVDTGVCPRGGCWERLLRIVDLSADSYVIQLDSDVLTRAPLPEVSAAIDANVSFTLASSPGLSIVGVEEAAAAVAAGDPRETQFAAEQALPVLPADVGRRYVRGSAGFAGFAHGATRRAEVEAFSVAMQKRLGDRWSEWGTEQVASNWVVANAPGGRLLPWERYRCFYGETLPRDAALVHFIGTWRYRDGVFVALAREVISTMERARAS
jgi:hypothetical protein